MNMFDRFNPIGASENSISAAAIDTPVGGTTVGYGETFNADEFTGTANFEVGIFASKARALTPDLKLKYTSGAGNGLFGQGWSMDLPSFRRRTDNGISRYDKRDRIIGPSGKVLVPVCYRDSAGKWIADETKRKIGGRDYRVALYRERSENRFDQIELWTDVQSGETFWKVTDAENSVTIYGDTPATRLSDPDHPSRVFQWRLSEIRDAVGNRAVYHYETECASGGINLYPTSIEYGNYKTSSQDDAFAFALRFDYANPQGAPPRPSYSVMPRQDPFSSFRAGFEIRTERLCRAILMVHRMADVQVSPEQVVSVTTFEYDMQGGPSRLNRVRRTGWRIQSDGTASPKSMPPIDLTYTEWRPEGARFVPLSNHEAPVPQPLDGSTTRFVDLYGEGRPGVLATQPPALIYWPPSDGGSLGSPRSPDLFPAIRPGAKAMLTDVEGNGHLDLMVVNLGGAGYFRNNNDGTWEAFAPFPSTPTDLGHPTARLIDLNGNGRADLLSNGAPDWRVALSQGADGFGGVQTVPAPDGTAIFQTDDPAMFVGFADMFGDGLQHLVRVGSGAVWVWPNLGYGRFGAPRLMMNAPLFSGDLTAERILMADTSGDGPADLILIGATSVTLYPNQFGNGFGVPVEIAIPSGFNLVDFASSADVYGRGASAVMISQVLPQTAHLALDFTCGTRPFFLSSINNNIGARTHITYRSSTDYYLADKAAGFDWATKLSFPVQVVDQIETYDDVAKASVVRVFQYRDGFFDPVERQFQGFGYVQTQDYPAFDPAIWHFPRARLVATPDKTSVEPQMVRSWRLTGASLQHGTIQAQLNRLAWHGDREALTLEPFELDADMIGASGETLRQAYVALAGQVVRTETFGIAPDGSVLTTPYQVEQSQALVRMIQPVLDGKDAVFNVTTQAQARLVYDQVPDDPRIEHQCVLAFDRFGHPLRKAAVAYPRRRAPPGQSRQLVCDLKLHTFGMINHVDGRYENGSGNTRPALDKKDGAAFHTIGKIFEEQSFELSGFDAPAPYFDRSALIRIAGDALDNQIAFGKAFTPGQLQARTFDWSQNVYWAENQAAALPLQEIAPLALLHHIAAAQMPQSLAAEIYNGITEAEIAKRTGNSLREGYWWSPGLIEHYYGAELFYLQKATENPFGASILVDYDTYALAPKTLTDPLGGVRAAMLDYQALSPSEITDINENKHEFLYDPLGLLIVSTVSGTYEGSRTGNAPLSEYQLIPDPDCAAILADPARFLQKASSFFYYDLESWATPERLPPHSIEIVRLDYLNGGGGMLKPSALPDYGLTFKYFDGLGRSLAKVELVSGDAPFYLNAPTFVEAHGAKGAAAVWRVQDQVRYDERGTPTRRYQPYLISVPSIDLLPDRPHWKLRYDALYRETGTTTPKGFLTRTDYAAWQTELWDANDTVVTSSYYRTHIDDPNLPKAEKRALDLAAAFENTPTTRILDPLGRAIQERQLLVDSDHPAKVPQLAASWLDTTGQVIAFADARFCAEGSADAPVFYNLGARHDMAGRVIALHSADAGDIALKTPLDGKPALKLYDFSGQPVTEWDRRGYERIILFDALRQPVSTRVKGLSLDQTVERTIYGTQASRNNVHKPVEQYDQSGIRRTEGYNIAGNPADRSVQYRMDYATEANWDDPRAVQLQKAVYRSDLTYTAQSNPLDTRYHNGAVLSRIYTRNSWMQALHLMPEAGGAATAIIPRMEYAPNGGPVLIELGTGAISRFTYDPETLRLERLVTRTADQTAVQDLGYTYDPVGNVMAVANPLGVPGSTGPASGDAEFAYDSLYRLTSATGREKSDSGNVLDRYTQTYSYDASGNLLKIKHTAKTTWSRIQAVSQSSNHAVPNDMAQKCPVDGFFDADGLLGELPDGKALFYDQARRLAQARSPGVGSQGALYFQYDTNGERTRKVELEGAATLETLYIDDQIIETSAIDAVELQLRVGNRLLSLVRMQSSTEKSLEITCRYPLNSRTGSVSAELSEDGALLRYEEYYPFGETAFAATFGTKGPSRFQFAGKERDGDTGLYYFGQRYYIPGQARWTAPDPAGTADGPNLFSYVGNNPLTLIDPMGTCGETPEAPPKPTSTQLSFKTAAKQINLFSTLMNAVSEAGSSYLGHSMMPTNMLDVGRASGLVKLISMAGFGGMLGGLSGMTYYGMDMRKYGVNRYNASSFTGNAILGYEGLLIYRTFLISGHTALESAHRRIGVVGMIADTLKIPKEIHDGNYGNAFFYGLLSLGNARAAIPDKVYYSAIDRFMASFADRYQRSGAQSYYPMAPNFKIDAGSAAKTIAARHMLIAAVAWKSMQMLTEYYQVPTQQKGPKH
ncbi:SpvB/TcaC N-terminal domain-containing protein [Rhizobium leguminosarum]|uniref:SpvB/TcaC N-terminal domain-containing protein n=1 Tax=Rhizobium leguminosarum TaxID=384 RepID=UPI00143F1BE4|nr:SpvB/TcaC N-terminal domain-containing protein [Rhizobium leguminosarum]NKL24485.1 hypothetical protein [Rhizobium leguminosarum bv. viciae]